MVLPANRRAFLKAGVAAAALAVTGLPRYGPYDPSGWPRCCGRYMLASMGTLTIISDRAFGAKSGSGHMYCINCGRVEQEKKWKTPDFPD